jgi:hypothetical protein
MIDATLVELAKRTNLIELVGKSVELRRESATEWSGPCVRCQGTDRLHVKADAFFCRKCHPQFGDAIEYTRWLHRVDFAGAIGILTGQTEGPKARITTPQPTTKQPQRKDAQYSGWAEDTQPMVTEAQAQLSDGSAYLESRGLHEATTAAYGLGFRTDAPLPGTWHAKERRHTVDPQPAIVIPWYRGGKLAAVRYRFLSLHTYIDIDGKERKVRQSSVYDSDFTGALYGGHVLPEFCTMAPNDNGRNAESLRTLVLCEGEINAMSIWQEMEPCNWDVLSLGSESQKLSAAALSFAERYGRVIIWMDNPEMAKRVMSQIAGSVAISSPVIDDRQIDANIMLQTGELLDFLVEARKRACQNEDERERVKWDLWEAGR